MNNNWGNIKQKLESFQTAYCEPISKTKTSQTIPDSPLCGGGKLMLSIDSNYSDITYYVTKSDFWAPIFTPQEVFSKYLMKPAPLGGITLSVNNKSTDTSMYSNSQDMTNASINSVLPHNGGTLEISTVSPAQSDYIIMDLKSVGGTVNLTLDLWSKNYENNFFIMEGVNKSSIWVIKEHKSFVTVNAAMAARVFGAKNIEFNYKNKVSASMSFDIEEGINAFVIISVKGGKDSYDHREKAIQTVNEFCPVEKSELLKQNSDWWKDYWLKSNIDINDSLIEKYYYGSLYVLGASVDIEGRTPPGLAGGWINDPSPIWGGNYTMNYNGEAPFWPVFSSNRAELARPYARMLNDFIPTGRLLAKEMNTKGIILPVMIEPWGISDYCDSLYQKSNATLAAISLIWYYEYTLDAEFLREYAYPYLLECMDFWEDNLVLDSRGRYIIEKSAQRERTPGDLNAGSELGYVQMLLIAMIRFSDILSCDSSCREKWHKYLEKLSDYPTTVYNRNTVFKECENRMDISFMGIGDNPVNLDHVYPGETLDLQPREDHSLIARNTLDVMDSWNQPNAFPRVFSQAVRAKYDASKIINKFRERLSLNLYPNETIRKNCTFLPMQHGFEGVGGIECINSMLAQAHDNIIKVFSIWDKAVDASFNNIRVKGAFLVSSKLKNGEVVHLEIYSENGGVCSLQNPYEQNCIKIMCGNEEVVFSHGDGWFEFQTNATQSYIIKKDINVKTQPVIKSVEPLILILHADDNVKASRARCEGAVDIILDPQIKQTEIMAEVVMSDGSHVEKLNKISFFSEDKSVADTDDNGNVFAVGAGKTYIRATVSIMNKSMTSSLCVQVMSKNIVTDLWAISQNGNVNEKVNAEIKPTIFGDGMTGADVLDQTRMNPYGHGMFAKEFDNENFIIFDMKKVYSLDELWLWNYNCPDDNYRKLWWVGGTACGIKDAKIEYSADLKEWVELKTQGYPFSFAKADGSLFMSATNLDMTGAPPISFYGTKARYVKLSVENSIGKGNWGGKTWGFNQIRFTYLL